MRVFLVFRLCACVSVCCVVCACVVCVFFVVVFGFGWFLFCGMFAMFTMCVFMRLCCAVFSYFRVRMLCLLVFCVCDVLMCFVCECMYLCC